MDEGYLLENRRMVPPGRCWYIYGLTMRIKPTLYIQDVCIACDNHVLNTYQKQSNDS